MCLQMLNSKGYSEQAQLDVGNLQAANRADMNDACLSSQPGVAHKDCPLQLLCMSIIVCPLNCLWKYLLQTSKLYDRNSCTVAKPATAHTMQG